MRTLGNLPTHLHLLATDSFPVVGSARIAAFLHLPRVLSEFGIDVREVAKEAGVRPDIFNDPDNLIPYPDVGRLLSVSARHTHCDHIGLLVGQHSRLAVMGLAGEIALCMDSAGEGLQRFADCFTLQNTAATVSVLTMGGFTRFVYAITEPGMGDTSQIQLGAMAIGFNILQDLCGPGWLPTVVTVASSAPSNLRPCHKFFRAPLRFDSGETSLIFESRWLDRPLPSVDPQQRRRIEAAVKLRQAAMLGDFPTTVRRVLRKQLIANECSMESVAAELGMHRRTLDRRLKRHGMLYGTVVESVKCVVACQLLRDTDLQMQQVAESLRYSNAANFSTAFRRWTGVTPSAYRRQELVSRRAV
jgi:AraC-like DNA-binding protein